MGQFRFLSAVHEKVRRAAESGVIIDAYRLADDLLADNSSLGMSRRKAVDTVIAAGVVYGAPMLLDPAACAVLIAAAPAPLADAAPARAVAAMAG